MSDKKCPYQSHDTLHEFSCNVDGGFRCASCQSAVEDDLRRQLAAANEQIHHWRTKAECYGNIVHGCSPALEKAGFPVDGEQRDGAVGGVRRAVEALAARLAAVTQERDFANGIITGLNVAIEHKDAENDRLRDEHGFLMKLVDELKAAIAAKESGK